ncbi:MAG: hypothetical protein KJ666_02445 [Bacteroidetes bacterium]|nr:hypothetical protein [Bacteroidota bacterium]
MSSTTVRITGRAYRLLQDIKKRTGDSFQTIIEMSLDNYKEKQFWNEVSDAYKNLRDSANWNEELDERRLWDSTISDGLEKE